MYVSCCARVYRDPTTYDSVLGGPCMAAYGGPVDPYLAFGDFGKSLYLGAVVYGRL